jgi:hypothetical protein
MGLWGSKQQKDIKINNPEPAEVFVTEKAITNVLHSVNDSKNAKKKGNPDVANNDMRLLPDLHDKRIAEYEHELLKGFGQATKEVEELFKERYQTVPVCLDLQQNVSKCYSQNSKSPLNCIDLVNEFNKCVELEKQKRFGLTTTGVKSDRKANIG